MLQGSVAFGSLPYTPTLQPDDPPHQLGLMTPDANFPHTHETPICPVSFGKTRKHVGARMLQARWWVGKAVGLLPGWIYAHPQYTLSVTYISNIKGKKVRSTSYRFYKYPCQQPISSPHNARFRMVVTPKNKEHQGFTLTGQKRGSYFVLNLLRHCVVTVALH